MAEKKRSPRGRSKKGFPFLRLLTIVGAAIYGGIEVYKYLKKKEEFKNESEEVSREANEESANATESHKPSSEAVDLPLSASSANPDASPTSPLDFSPPLPTPPRISVRSLPVFGTGIASAPESPFFDASSEWLSESNDASDLLVSNDANPDGCALNNLNAFPNFSEDQPSEFDSESAEIAKLLNNVKGASARMTEAHNKILNISSSAE